MTSEISASNIEKYIKHIINEKTLFIPNGAIDIKIRNLSKIGQSVNNIYSFYLFYKYKREEVKLNLVLKLFEQTEFHRNVCNREYQIMMNLKKAHFLVPTVHLVEINKNILGGPFIIMEKIEGPNMASHLKTLDKKGFRDALKYFAETLVLLHELRLEKIWSDVLTIPENEYAYAKKTALVKEELNYAKKWDYQMVTDWLRITAEKCPCYQYSLLHIDMNLKNFIINNEGKIFFSDWEWGEVGDPLRDVGSTYHEITHMFGNEAGFLFLKYYVKSSKRKIDSNSLNFYLVSSGLKLALYYRFLSTKKLGKKYLISLFGMKFMPLFPFIRWHFKRRRKRLEIFLQNKISDYESSMYATRGSKILSWIEIEDILKLVNASSSDLILDVGTGSGRVARVIVSKTGARVIGIDGRPPLLAAKKRKGDLCNYELVVANGQYLPFRKHVFNSIICIRALKYFKNYNMGISEMARVLKPFEHLIIDISSMFGYELILKFITKSSKARGHRVFNIYKIKNLLQGQKLYTEESLPLQKIPHNVWNISSNSTVLTILIILENTLKKISPTILSRSILLKCKKVPYLKFKTQQ